MRGRDHVGENVRRLRIAKGWTQERLAEGADLDRVTIVRIETAVASARLDHLLLIARALGVQLAYLVRE